MTASANTVFENWNRFYDPSIGRYLQPEPLLSHSPKGVQILQQSQGEPAASLPVYAYALNNPVTKTDPDGRGPKLPCTPSDSTYSCCIKQHPDEPERCGGDKDDPYAKCAALALAAFDKCMEKFNDLDKCLKAMEKVYENCKKKIPPGACGSDSPTPPFSPPPFSSPSGDE